MSCNRGIENERDKRRDEIAVRSPASLFARRLRERIID
jgi:hypothetical protein